MPCRLCVARGTGAIHFIMVNGNYWYPRICTVASLTYITGIDMRWTLACCLHAIMTTYTVTRQRRVIHNRA